MHTTPKRQPKHPNRKLRPVPKAASWKLVAKHPLPVNAKIYYNLNGEMFAAYTRQPNAENKHWIAIVSGIGHKNRVSAFLTKLQIIKIAVKATANFDIGERKMLEITDLTKDKRLWEKQTGELLFRAVLNEATPIAKREKANIWIEADNEKLKGYYETFGFEFNNPKKPMEGILTIFKTNGSAKK